MLKIDTFTLVIILFLLSISLVYALPVQGDDLEVCSCTIISNPITVENQGDSIDTFYITQYGPASKWSNIFPDQVILEPGEAVVIDNFINLPCDVTGNSHLTTSVASSTKTETSFQRLKIRRCPNIELVFENLTQTGCNCTPFVFEFWIKNIGEHNEIYNMKLLDGVGSAFTSSINPIILTPGDTQNVKLYISPRCDAYGELNTTFRITSQQSKYYADALLTLDIEACPALNVSENVTAVPTFLQSSKQLLTLFIVLLLLLVAMIIAYYVITAVEAPYYKPVRIKEPKLRKPREVRFEVDEFVKSKAFKTAVALVALLIIALLIYISVQIVALIIPVNETNLTINQTLNITENITQPVINQTVNETGVEKLDLGKCSVYFYYTALGFAILFLILLVRVRTEEKPVKKRKRRKKAKALDIMKKIRENWKMVLLFVLILIVLVLAYYFRASIIPGLASLKAYILMYWVYIVVGFVILAALLLVLSKIRK